ncbi:helix-turn-helix domain-containing protein [Epilithonimonas sp.]|uniref:helix-turn-helix domain-containing protein n=1 Tax=Epilithonimonas sp. TaxID=2894511 RepID=UPI0028AD8EA7|nr:helix-turn-helix domain-containing protein [Epilithonimonas sp.]
MSSNISIQKVCEYCGKDFTAKTTVTRCCSDDCAKKAYKARKRAEKINNAIEVVEVKKQKKFNTIEDLREREFLTAKEVSILLNCSVRSVYYYISNGIIEATNLGNRLTRIKRSNIDKLFNDNLRSQPKEKQYNISECFSISEAQKKYNISESALQKIIQREEIPKIKQGKFVYIPKFLIDEVFNTKKKDVF